MNKKAKIAIAAGTTLVLGISGFLIYRGITKRNEAARKYLAEVDDNGGQPLPPMEPTYEIPEGARPSQLPPKKPLSVVSTKPATRFGDVTRNR